MAKKDEPLLKNQTCSFGRFSVGGTTASIPVKFPRGDISASKADTLIASQCRVDMCADPLAGSDADGQQTMESVAGAYELKRVTVDIASVRSDKKHRSCQFTFNLDALSDEQIGALNHFAEGAGQVTLTKTGDAEEKRGRPKAEDD